MSVLNITKKEGKMDKDRDVLKMVQNVKVNSKGLNDWVLTKITKRIKDEACVKALTKLKEKYQLRSGINIDFIQLSDEDDYKKYQLEFENLVVLYLERIINGIVIADCDFF